MVRSLLIHTWSSGWPKQTSLAIVFFLLFFIFNGMSGKSKKSILDALIDDDDDESDSDVEAVDKEPKDKEEEEEEVTTKRPKSSITLEDLQRAGFKGGPSVLLMRAHDEQTTNFGNWYIGSTSACVWLCPPPMHVSW